MRENLTQQDQLLLQALLNNSVRRRGAAWMIRQLASGVGEFICSDQTSGIMLLRRRLCFVSSGIRRPALIMVVLLRHRLVSFGSRSNAVLAALLYRLVDIPAAQPTLS